MRMNLRWLWRSFAAISIAFATFGAAPGAMAGIIGSATLDITNGIFAYNSGAEIGVTPYESVTGDFAYTNTLPAGSESYSYQGFANVNVNGGTSGGGQTFSRSMNFGYTSLNSILLTPDGAAAFGLVNMFAGATSGSSTFAGYDFSWSYDIISQTGNSGNGSFSLWSMVDYSGKANPEGLVFPANATFDAQLAFNARSKGVILPPPGNAVPEPGTLGLLSLGLLLTIGGGLRRKRKNV